jgi:hypothetical protein
MTRAPRLEILLAPDKVESVRPVLILVLSLRHGIGRYLPRFAVLVTEYVQRATKTLGTAEEDTSFGRRVKLPDTTEDHVPVGATEVGR